MDMGLGGFGDARLEKGGRLFWSGLFRMAGLASACGVLAATVPARCVLPGFCTIGA